MTENASKVTGSLFKFKLSDGTFADLFVPGAIGTIRAEEPGTAFSCLLADGTRKTVFIPGATETSFSAGCGPIAGPPEGLLVFYIDEDVDPGDTVEEVIEFEETE